ncbi:MULTISPECIES: ABC transporter ATP-binding protein [unclassified Methylosinus]|uniref:ABC transporter ATP-binding protein n=1 Tax=unclassified Methylosinus TaxID=2624500 RepID=UPI000364D7BC|nr:MULTISPECIES: ABC transporter ATP-binding protein [unclassified Methylosinus]OAI22666.1 ABC transporter ATP-binding protein [Methylosinus sp. R-45379]TDX66648.1 ABC-2 type transport system ATP-binding protein [Methylosinus sp. sav-2]
MLEARELTKRYEGKADRPALDRLNLHIPGGEAFCLLGPNGAGKTTTVNLFLNFIAPTSGQALVGGVDSAREPLEARRRLAYIPETVMLYGALTGLENLEYFTEISGGRRLARAELLALLGEAGLAEEAAFRRVSGYSKGMRQKVGVAVALARRAQALLLDEPTSGLDPLAANEFAALVEKLRKQGMAILMVTHDLFLAKQCGTRIGVMQAGRLVSVFGADDVDHLGLERAYLEQFRGAAA